MGRKLAFYSFKEIAELFHVSVKTIRNWSWKGYFRATGYKTIKYGRRIALVEEKEVKRLVAKFIISIEQGGSPGRPREKSKPRKRKSASQPALTQPYNPAPWKKELVQELMSPVLPMGKGDVTPIEETSPSPIELVKALLRTGSFTPKEIHEETGLELSIIKEILSILEKEGLVEKGSTGIWDPEECHCYTIKENHR